MPNSHNETIRIDSKRLAALELDRDAHSRRLDTLAATVQAMSETIDEIVNVLPVIKEGNGLVADAIERIAGQLVGIHARLDAHNTRHRTIEDRLGVMQAGIVADSVIVGRLREQVANLTTDVESLSHPDEYLIKPPVSLDVPTWVQAQHLPVGPTDQIQDDHLESDYDDRYGDDGS